LAGRPHEAEQDLLEAVDISDSIGDRYYRSSAQGSLGIIANQLGDYEAVGPLADAQFREATEVGNEGYRGFGKIIGAAVERSMGNVDAVAERAAEAVAILEPVGVDFGLCFAHTLLMWAALQHGDFALADAHLERAVAAGASPPFLGLAFMTAAQLERARDDLARAEEVARSALAHMGPGFAYTAEGLETLAGVLAMRGAHDEASRLFGAADALRARHGVVRWAADEAAYQSDVDVARAGLSDRFAKEWEDGAALSAEEAVAYATRGRGERRRPTSGWDSLTPTELDVVRLVAEGLTNPQIGERLFISRGTVKTHLAHVFAKVGVSTRSELTREALRRAI
jgi:DNA-binding CsgD family transcriptional regulator